MKIVVVSGGCPSKKYPDHGIFCFDQAKALAKFGHTVILAAVDLHSIRHWRKWGFRSFEKEGVMVEEINIPCGRIPKRIFYAIGKRAFAALYERIEAKHGKPDILHSHFTDNSYLCAEYANQHHLRLVVTEHSSAITEQTLSAQLMEMSTEVYRRADALLAVSGALAKKIETISGVKATVLHNVLDERSFPQVKPRGKPLQEEFRFVVSGHFIPRKGYPLLLSAFAKLPYRNIRLTIFGSGALGQELKEQAKKLRIADRVEFMGFCPRWKMGEVYPNCDCFVLPSRNETFGVVYIEAMMAGLPVIATRCGGPEDFLNEGNGLLVNVDDLDGLTNAMEYMYYHAKEYDPDEIREKTLAMFSADHIASELTKIYQAL